MTCLPTCNGPRAPRRERRRGNRTRPPRPTRRAPTRRCERKRRTCYRVGCRLRARVGPQAATATGEARQQATARCAAMAGAPWARGAHGPGPTVAWHHRAPRWTPMAYRQARQARANTGALQGGQRRGMARLPAGCERRATLRMRRRRSRTYPTRRSQQAPTRRYGRERRTCYRAGGKLQARDGPQAVSMTGRARRQAAARRVATARAPRERGTHGPGPTPTRGHRAPRRTPMTVRQARQARNIAGA